MIDFEVVDWADEVHVLKVRLFGTGPKGEAVDEVIPLGEPVPISEVHRLVTKMNNGNYRTGM